MSSVTAKRLAAILDVDGTLVDSNYHHALAWYRAFREHDIVVPLWRLHRHVGMGGKPPIPPISLGPAMRSSARAVASNMGRAGIEPAALGLKVRAEPRQQTVLS